MEKTHIHRFKVIGFLYITVNAALLSKVLTSWFSIVFIALVKGLLTGVSSSQARITTRLQQYRTKAELSRNTRPQAWVPREKLPRPLTSSASAIRKLMRKAELMGISTDIFPVDTADASASIDGRRKHKQPALSAEFVNYYLGKETQIDPVAPF